MFRCTELLFIVSGGVNPESLYASPLLSIPTTPNFSPAFFHHRPQCIPLPLHLTLPHMYYSFDLGSIHVAMLSTEHVFETGSPQWQWLQVCLN